MKASTNILNAFDADRKRHKVLRGQAASFKRSLPLLLMLVPGIIYFIVFHYIPMYGVTIAFKNYRIYHNIMSAPWVGFKNFEMFFSNPMFWKLIKNTLLLNIYQLVWGFWPPILLALLLNELSNQRFKKTVQTITYLPHFVSTVVIVGMLFSFSSPSTGLFNNVVKFFGGQPIPFMARPEWFRTMYIASDIWKGLGWGSIIYLAALTNVDVELYEAAYMDGANRLQRVVNITLPAIMPTITILLIFAIGGLMKEGAEKIIIMQNNQPLINDTSEIISSYVYKQGIRESNYGYATAVGLFNSVISIILLSVANFVSKKLSETSLW